MLTKQVLKQSSVIWSLLTGLIVAMIYQGMLNSTLSHLIKTKYDEIIRLGSMIIGAASLAGIMQAIRWGWEPWLAPWFGKQSDATNSRRPLLTSTLLIAAIMFAVIPLTMPIQIWLLLLLILQITATVLTTLSDTVASDEAAATTKSIMTVYSLTTDLGAALGPLLAYIINEAMGVEYSYWLASLLLGLLSLKWLSTTRSKPSLSQAN
jgi:MFS family permease